MICPKQPQGTRGCGGYTRAKTLLFENGGYNRMINFLFRTKFFVLFFKSQRYPSDELFKRSQIMDVFELYVFELLKLAVPASRGSQLPNIKTLYINDSSPAFTRSVCSDMFHVPEVRRVVSRQSLI